MMDDLWGNSLQAIVISFVLVLVAYIIQECLNYARRLLVDTEQKQITSELECQRNMYNKDVSVVRGLTLVPAIHEVTSSRDNLVDGSCVMCPTPTNLKNNWWKLVQYWSGRCQIMRKGHEKICWTLNESGTATTGHTPHMHGSKTKQSGSLDGKSDKQSSNLSKAVTNSLLLQNSKKDGASVFQNIPESHSDDTEEIGKSKKVTDSSVKITVTNIQPSMPLGISLTEHIVSGTSHDKWDKPVRNLIQYSGQANHASEASQVTAKAEMNCHDELTPVIPLTEAKGHAPALRDNSLSKNCVTCFAPASTRCSRCKSVRYCSEKCQINHWRLEHKEMCHPIIQPTTVASSPKSPMQTINPTIAGTPRHESPKPESYLISFKTLNYGNITNKCGIKEGTSHDKIGTQAKNCSIKISENATVGISLETNLKGEGGANENSLHLNNSSEESCTSATIGETPRNMNARISKTIQKDCDESIKISEKRNEPTISPVIMVSSNSESITQIEFEAGMHQDETTTNQVAECSSENKPLKFKGTFGNKKTSLSLEQFVHVLKELQEYTTMTKIAHKSTQETKRLEDELAKERTKLQELEKIQDEVLKENQVLKTMQHDMAKELQHLHQQREKFSMDFTTNCMEFSVLELEEATRNFHKKLKIGEGGYGSVYKGDLHCTKVAIKVLHSKSNQGGREFYQEVEILRKVRHPNIVTLIGVCSQIQALIYEFIPNGSLDNYLKSTSRRKLLSWKVRMQIASDICSALIFLHSTKPHGIAHGDLKPANILLDSNYQGKLSDFGISRQLVKTNDTITPHHLTDDPKGTLAYIDPEYMQTGEMNPQCDVYAFGIILLQLITGKSATGIYKLVQEALKSKKLNEEIDASAKWPSDKAIKMAKLGIRCCNSNREKRPDLANEVWREIESLKLRSSVF